MKSFVLLCLLLPILSLAQFTTEFEHTYGGTGFDRALHLQKLKDGGYILCGYTNTNNTNYDILLIKTDSNGQQLWQKQLANHKNDIGWGVLELPDKSLMVHGSTGGKDSLEDDILLIKLDQYGEEYWRKTFGNNQHERTTQMLFTKDGYLTLIGQRNAKSGKDIDSYLLKVDLHGNLIREETYGSPFPERTFYAVEKENGDLLVSGLILPYSNNKADIYLLCLNSNGDSLWSKSIGDPDVHEIAHSFNHTNEPNRFVLTGYISTTKEGFHDALWMKIDEKGNILSQQTYGTGEDIRLMHAEPSLDNGWVITGYVNNDPKDATADIIVLKLDKEGKFIWERRWGIDDKDDQGYWITMNDDGSFTVTGYTYTSGVNGDVWMLRMKEKSK